jgi:predicted nucleic acid-binding protein
MPQVIILDTGPLSNCVVNRMPDAGEPLSPSQACRLWLTECENRGATVLVPAIAYYEVLREIERREATAQRQRLQTYCFAPGRFIPLATAHLESAARLWAQARKTGTPTASDNALDGDTILCAQVLSLNLPDTQYVVATTNPKHLGQFVRVEEWQNINP